MAKEKKEKKQKTNEQKKKGFIIRGIAYAIVLVILFTGSFIINHHKDIKNSIYYSLMPASMEANLNTENPITFYHEETKTVDENNNEIINSTYYYYDNDEKVEVQDGLYYGDNGSIMVGLGFTTSADKKFERLNNIIKYITLLVIAIIVVYAFRLAYFLFLRSEEKKEEVQKILLERQKNRNKNN